MYSADDCRQAVSLRDEACELEPAIDKELERMAEAVGGRIGAKRVKEVLSTTRKLMRESCGQPHLGSLQEVSQMRITDMLGYTVVFEQSEYIAGAADLLSSLGAQYDMLACRNYWPKGNTYHGINKVVLFGIAEV